MKLSDIKNALAQVETVEFILPNGSKVPAHFHVTEVGKVEKHFIDCGGTTRKEARINFQLWEDVDYDHRLAPQKLINIIELSASTLGLTDEEIEVEYQGETIGKYDLEFKDGSFYLLNTKTDCLAKDKCGIPVAKEEKKKVSLASLGGKAEGGCCSPYTGCC
ncbi:DUF6428 family protein [Paracrocinitomix mangrovi]|uniref:DUF6428 family protein n=1 Tax=Paracrocinitomix mangrovi TaxID=2862509 RepID=UPI001C8DD715|nr:DUF6428 family protein [Paracrocinitomix mangrovi]UKN02556.1 DUF6428 family protein [Paracrocinitomix mangrovi]